MVTWIKIYDNTAFIFDTIDKRSKLLHYIIGGAAAY